MAKLPPKEKFLQKTPVQKIVDHIEFKLGNDLKLVGRLSDMPENIVTMLAWHGLSQKIGDCAANCASEKAYSAAFTAMQTTYDNLVAGVWQVKGGGNSDLAEALVRLQMADDVEDANAIIRGLDDAELKGVTNHPQVKVETAKIRMERANAALAASADKAIDLSALFKKAPAQEPGMATNEAGEEEPEVTEAEMDAVEPEPETEPKKGKKK